MTKRLTKLDTLELIKNTGSALILKQKIMRKEISHSFLQIILNSSLYDRKKAIVFNNNLDYEIITNVLRLAKCLQQIPHTVLKGAKKRFVHKDNDGA